MKSARLTNIDALRGIASLAVCWFHLTNTYAPNSLARFTGQYGWLGVEVFFVLSGFIIPYAMFRGGYTFPGAWRSFISKRILRIEPPYLLSIILVLALWHASTLAPNFAGAPPPRIFTVQTLLHVGYLTGMAGHPWLNPVFWTLAIEFQFYLLVSFVFAFLGSTKKKVVLITDFALISVALIFTSDVFVFKYLGLFMLGIAVFQYRAGLLTNNTLVILLVGATLITGVALGSMVALVGLLTSIIILSPVNLGKSKFTLWLGSISYSLYLVHVPIGGRVINFGKRFVDSPAGEVLLSLTALVVSLVAAYIFFLVIERPFQNMAARIKYTQPLPVN